jgi:predicted metal-dependent phosphoesterase TrpH
LYTPELVTVLAVELHVHSDLSYDGRDPVTKLLQQAAAVGLDGLAITDHDEISASLEAAERASEYGLVGIPGMEVTTSAGHVLAIGVEELVPPDLSFAETVDRIHDLGGIAIVPHPFQEFRSGVLAEIDESELTRADAIEVFNSRLLTGRANRQAERFARRSNMPRTAGSDAHIFEMVGRAVTHVETDERSVAAIVDAIRDGRTSVEGRRTPWRVSLRQAAGGTKRKVLTRVRRLLE